MPPRVVLFGATGYTGRLTASELAAAGTDAVLAGRDRRRLEALSGAADAAGLQRIGADD